MFLLYLFVCNCTCECMFCVGDHLVQAVLPFVLPIFGKIDNNNNNNTVANLKQISDWTDSQLNQELTAQCLSNQPTHYG